MLTTVMEKTGDSARACLLSEPTTFMPQRKGDAEKHASIQTALNLAAVNAHDLGNQGGWIHQDSQACVDGAHVRRLWHTTRLLIWEKGCLFCAIMHTVASDAFVSVQKKIVVPKGIWCGRDRFKWKGLKLKKV